ncbi:hypothetical protein EVAR_97526_1 [Eumeta japonica]|uniref:Uncharacterized protein n=1 Tax=Eumeta variegata TaxID=151549 RepID=A0A4C1WKS6_EUMVA|nr:hypothetical protein EVAR_97526_1 [Eumeta japonica]
MGPHAFLGERAETPEWGGVNTFPRRSSSIRVVLKSFIPTDHVVNYDPDRGYAPRSDADLAFDNEDNDQNILYDNVYESGAPTVTFQCNRKAVNSVLNIQEENDRSGVLPWPILDPVPINEFTCDGYICRAFPTLFPTGKENEEDYEVINTVQIEQLHDWMEVAAGPQNINQEDDLGRREIDIRYQWHSISSKQLLNSLETFIENEKLQEIKETLP